MLLRFCKANVAVDVLLCFSVVCVLVGCSPTSRPGVTAAPVTVSPSTSPSPAHGKPTPTVAQTPLRLVIPAQKRTDPSAPVPEFQGPYAGELRVAWVNSTSDLQRKALQDGTLSEAEVAAMDDQMHQCLSTNGAVFIQIGREGSLGVKFPPQMESQTDDIVQARTEVVYGPLQLLERQLRRNPLHEDEHALMAACLVRVGLAPAGYSAEDYGRDVPNNFPFSTDDKRFGDCIQDPRHAGK